MTTCVTSRAIAPGRLVVNLGQKQAREDTFVARSLGPHAIRISRAVNPRKARGRLRRRVLLGKNRVARTPRGPEPSPIGLDEWGAIRPKLLNRARGVPRVNDRGVLNRAGDLEHPGAVCRMPSVPTPLATIASFAGGRRVELYMDGYRHSP